jgi:hypothetical protein
VPWKLFRVLKDIPLENRGVNRMMSNKGPRRILPALVLACAFAAPLCPRMAAAADPPATVRLVVDYGDDVQIRFGALPWKEGMTVIDALEAAGKLAHGVSSHHRGSGATALVTQIGDLKNAAPTKDRNSTWMFWVNKNLAEVGAGSYMLHPRDIIVWKYTTPNPAETPEP